MAYAVVFWTEDQQYSVVLSSKIHGDVVENRKTMVDRDEGRKGSKSAIKTTAYPAKIIKIGGGCTYALVANCLSAMILLNCYKYPAQPKM